jgi:hypothetical protein
MFAAKNYGVQRDLIQSEIKKDNEYWPLADERVNPK